MALGNVLREMFVKISMRGGPKAEKELGRFRRGLKKVVGDIKAFQAHLSALAVAKAFSTLGAGISSVVRGFKELIVESSNLAGIQEESEKRVITSMKLLGDFSQAAFKDFKKFASEWQNASGFGDELILEQLALAKSFGATNQQAKELVEASIELASAQGKPLQETARQVIKTMGGFAGELGEMSVVVKDLTNAELRAGGAAKVLTKAFGGSSAKNIKTFSGSLKLLLATIGDAKELIGFPINKILVPAFKDMKDSIIAMTPVFERFGKKVGSAIQVIIRMFKNLGGQSFFSGIIDNFGEFVINMALLFEDLVSFMSGKDSAIGRFLDSKGGFANVVSDFITRALKGVIEAIPGILKTMLPLIEQVLTEVIKTLALTAAKATVSAATEGLMGKKFSGFQAPSFSFGSIGSGVTGNMAPVQGPKNTTNNDNKSTSVVQHIEVKASGMESFSKQLEMSYKVVEPFIGVL